MNLNYSRFFFFILLFNLSFSGIHAQIEIKEDEVEELFSINSEETREENPDEDLITKLEELKRNPVNINTAKREEFEKIIFLNDFQIFSLIDYRKKYGSFNSIYELPYVFGFNQQEAEKLSPYIYIGDAKPQHKKDISATIINRIVYDKSNSTDNNIPFKLYNRFLSEGNHFKTGITMENDQNEEFFKLSNRKGFDFYSCFFEYKPGSKILNTIIAGDYSAAFGQGLNIWGSYSTGKSLLVQSNRKTGQGFKPYTSANENSYLRGGAISITLKEINFNLFYSKKKVDANLIKDTSTIFFSSFQNTGYHITESEIEDENAVREELKGINVNINKNWIKTGITYHEIRYSARYLRNNTVDKQFLPIGKTFKTLSCDFSVFTKNTILYGEWAMCSNLKQSWILGANMKLVYNNYISIITRDYDVGYYSIYGNAFGENSENLNEKGFYIGLQNNSVKNLKLSCYADYFQFPWLNYQCIAPSNGSEHALHASYSINNNFSVSVKYKTETKEKSIIQSPEDKIKTQLYYLRNSSRLQLEYMLSNNLTFKNRLEISNYHLTENYKGYLMFHDIKYSIPKLYLTLYSRCSIFEIQSFDCRIYQYENDLRYTFYVPFLNGKGTKYYIMIKFKMKKLPEIYLKTEFINYVNQENKVLIKGQLVWSF